MKPRTRKEVVRSIEQRLTRIFRESAGEDDLSEIKSEKDRQVWRRGLFQILLAPRLRSELEDALKKRPEPTRQQMDKFFERMKSIDPLELLRPSLRHIARKLPPFPPGKPPKLNPGERRNVLTKVAALSSRSALPRKDVYRKVAKEYGVHWRTVQNLVTKARKKHREGI